MEFDFQDLKRERADFFYQIDELPIRKPSESTVDLDKLVRDETAKSKRIATEMGMSLAKMDDLTVELEIRKDGRNEAERIRQGHLPTDGMRGYVRGEIGSDDCQTYFMHAKQCNDCLKTLGMMYLFGRWSQNE